MSDEGKLHVEVFDKTSFNVFIWIAIKRPASVETATQYHVNRFQCDQLALFHHCAKCW